MRINMFALSVTLASAAALNGTANAGSIFDECREFRGMVSLSVKRIERPETPACLRYYTPMTDEFAFQSCRRELMDFKSKVENYLKCLKYEANESIEEYNGAVNSFNQSAQ